MTHQVVSQAAADPVRVGRWLADQLGDPAWRDCTLSSVGHGRSNLTFRVESAAGAVVLRRPPVGSVASTAHDMGRERRVLTALATSAVPVPRVLAHAEDGDPVDAPCYVMEMVDGVVPLAEPPAAWPDEASRRQAGDALIDVLVALHRLDPGEVGLADFGRPDGFMARQLRRWSTQWETWRDGSGVDPATVTEVTTLAGELADSLPVTQRSTIVHGDYRIDNLMYDHVEPGRIRAVLDWEMSTLGDPMADLGLLMIYWPSPGDPAIWRNASLLASPTREPGFPTRAELAARYAAGTGLSLEPLPWYTAFGAFKLAVVLAGILARVQDGAVPAEVAEGLSGAVAPLVALGRHVLRSGLPG
ncbi:phosphotransferase family protein [Pseudonocardia spinosispora]|uniref:phosphotransferase family protein n=1 Tax=Pseudonocardia spinosispora TaxID=103441 RepID=UPI00040585C0|nr:phosphotransferase family protein [Pseudonocardia spinosispora]